MIRKNLSTQENRDFWAFVEKTAKDVEDNFPAWKRGDTTQMDFQPLHDKLVVKRKVLEDIIKDSGIIITKQLQERPQEGTVLAAGPEVKDVKVGDIVMFGKHDGKENIIEGEDILVMRENQIWGILN